MSGVVHVGVKIFDANEYATTWLVVRNLATGDCSAQCALRKRAIYRSLGECQVFGGYVCFHTHDSALAVRVLHTDLCSHVGISCAKVCACAVPGSTITDVNTSLKHCGAKGIRTPGLFHAMEALYQLSYSPKIVFSNYRQKQLNYYLTARASSSKNAIARVLPNAAWEGSSHPL